MKKTIITLVLYFCSLILFSQNYSQTIRGRVIDADTELPLPEATIVITDITPQKGTTSDANGEFYFNDIPIGRHNLALTFIGYNSVSIKNLSLGSAKELVLNIRMQEKITNLKEITVNAHARKDMPINDMAMISARSFTVEETERYAGSLGDPARMASNYAGVSSAGDNRNDIVIRGNSPTGLRWRLDNVEIPNPNHFGSLGSTGGPVTILNNNLLTNSDFYTSAFPAEFGNATSGVFDLKVRNGNNQKHEFTGQIGFNGFELDAEGPFSKKSKASYLASYRYSTLDVFNKIGFSVAGSAIPQYQDLTFKINIPTKKGKISIFGLGGPSYIELLQSKDTSSNSYNEIGSDIYFGSELAVTGLSYLHYINSNTRLQTNISAQATHSYTKLDTLNNNFKPSLFYRGDFKEYKFSVSSELKKKFNARNNLSSGFNIDLYNTNYNDSVIMPDTSAFKNITNNQGNFYLFQAFAELKHRFTNNLSTYTGVHFQQASLNNSLSIEPRIATKWQFTDNQSFNFGFGMHSQLQPHTIYFTETRLDNGSYIKTNTKLKFSRSNQFVVGYNNLFTQNLRLKIETYYQHLYNIPVNENHPTFSILNNGTDFYNSAPDSLENLGTGKNYGVEITLEKFLSNGYYFLLTNSLFESKYRAYDGIERNTAFNGNFVLNALAGYEFKIGKNNILSFDTKATWAGGKRYVPIDIAASINKHETVYDNSKAFENRYPDYLRFDIRINFKLNKKRISQEWAIDIQNMTNHKNIFRQKFNSRSNKIVTDYQMGFFPMMLYRIKF